MARVSRKTLKAAVTGARFCALEGCEAPALPNSKYCAPEHRKDNARRRYDRSNHTPNVTGKSLDERITLEQERLRQKRLRDDLTELTRTAAKRQQYVDAIHAALQPFEPSEVFPLPLHDAQTEVDWVLVLSDWHIGQRTLIETTGGVYEQTLSVSRRQVDRLLQSISGIFHEAQGKHVRRILGLVLGDVVENDAMRPAQLREIEIPVVKQTIEAADLLSYFFRTVLQLPGLEELLIEFVPGNHDRTTQKAGNAGLAEHDYVDSFAWLIGEILKRGFENDPRVALTNHESFFGFREFGGLRHVFEHGSSIRTSGGSYGGVPFYPIVNAARHWESHLGGVDIVYFGHLHVPYTLPLGQQGRIIGNGALPPTSRFIQSRYKTIRRPQQTLVELHREHGITAIRDLYADVGLLNPGEVWDAVR